MTEQSLNLQLQGEAHLIPARQGELKPEVRLVLGVRLRADGHYSAVMEGLVLRKNQVVPLLAQILAALTMEQWRSRPWYIKVSERILAALRFMM